MPGKPVCMETKTRYSDDEGEPANSAMNVNEVMRSIDRSRHIWMGQWHDCNPLSKEQKAGFAFHKGKRNI